MIDLDELERLMRAAQAPAPTGDSEYDAILSFARMSAEEELSVALRNNAEELIAMARQAEALHGAVCQAVALLNVCPELARSSEGREAHLLLRRALIDYANSMREQEQKR